MRDGATEPSPHGGLLDDELAALGATPDEVLDVSASVNPYGPCPAVRRALARARIDRYPDPRATAARRAFAERAGVAVERVAIGNGAVDLMWTLARAVLRPGDRVLVVEPAFSEMRAAAERVGATIVERRGAPERDFAVDLGALDAAIAAHSPRLVYACSPQNPAGVCTPLAAFEQLARRHPQSLFVVDVSFLSLSERHGELGAPRDPRVVWLRSFTKDHALAGLRVGAAIAPDDVIAAIDRERPPWSVNALAQAAVIASTTDEAARFVDQSRARLLADRDALTRGLRALDLHVHPSDTVYVLVSLRGGLAATDLRRRLLERRRVLVRDATSFGLPHHVRIAARGAEQRERLLSALRGELAT
jgi:histidinol-phosphate/aromatic aminotransferase/cobyric acid decarboxylase-like protein